jgi:hypothetical protein
MSGGGGAVECGSEERWMVWLREGDVVDRRTTNGGRTQQRKGAVLLRETGQRGGLVPKARPNVGKGVGRCRFDLRKW